MRWTQTLNLYRATEWGLSLQQATLFAFLYELPSWAASTRMEEEDRLYYYASHKKIADELPILGMKKDAIYRNINKLIDLGLVDSWVVGGKRNHYAVTDKGKLWNSTLQILPDVTCDQASEEGKGSTTVKKPTSGVAPTSANETTSVTEPTHLGSKPEVTPVLGPTNNIINNNNINNTYPPTPQEGKEEVALSVPDEVQKRNPPDRMPQDFPEQVQEIYNRVAEKHSNACGWNNIKLDNTLAIKRLYLEREMKSLSEWEAYLESLMSSRFGKSMSAITVKFALKDDTVCNCMDGVYTKTSLSPRQPERV